MSAKSFSEILKEKQEIYDLLEQATERKLTRAEQGVLIDYWSYIVHDIINNSYTNYKDIGIEKSKLIALGFEFLDEAVLMQFNGRKKEPIEVSLRIELAKRIDAKIQSKRK